MSLESKICYIRKDALDPSLNLGINEFHFNMVKNGECDAVARIYKHTPGIILSKDQSVSDVNSDYCKNNSLSIATRPTGGGAVYVSPEHTLCYSLILNTNNDNVSKSLDITNMYKGFTEILVKNLKNVGLDVSLSGAGWYVMANYENDRIPIIGHSMHFQKNTYQIDGIVNLKKLPSKELSEAIHLRKLYSDSRENFIYSNNSFVDKNPESSDLTLIRDEKSEIDKLIGIYDLNLDEKQFVDILIDTINSFSGKMNVSDENYDYSSLNYVRREYGKTKGLGHCFFRYP